MRSVRLQATQVVFGPRVTDLGTTPPTTERWVYPIKWATKWGTLAMGRAYLLETALWSRVLLLVLRKV
jgi:hypothetical protein